MSDTAVGQEQRITLEEETRSLVVLPEEEEEEEEEEQLPQQPEISRHINKLETVGLAIILLGGFVHCCSSVVVKWSVSSMPTFEIIIVQAIFQILFGFLGCLWLDVKPFGLPGSRTWVFICGVFSTLTIACFYYSLTYLPLGEATVIFYLYPLLTTILAGLFLQQDTLIFGWVEAIFGVLCMLSVLLIAKPYILFGNSTNNNNIALIAAMMSAFFASCAYYAMHKINQQTHFLSVLFVMGWLLLLFSISLGSLFYQTSVPPTTSMDYLKLGLVGLTTICHQCLVYLGLRLAPTSIATMMLCINDILFSFIFGMGLFKEYPDVLSIVGTMLMICMTSIVAIHQWHKS